MRQINGNGVTSDEVAAAQWTVDTQVPAAPQVVGTQNGFTSSTSASVSFTTDDNAVAFCSVDGGAYSACDSPVALSSLGDGAHSVAVKQRNEAGTQSDASTVSWTVDTSAPAVPVLSNVPSGYVSSDSASITVSLGEPNLTAYCSIDGGDWGPCLDVAYGNSFVKALQTLSEGSHSIAVKSVDRARNVSTVASPAAWTVDTIAPDAPVVTANRSGYTKSKSAAVSFTTEPAAIVQCKVDAASTWSACSSPRSFTDLADGTHTVVVRQTDAAGNTSDEESVSWVVDTTAAAAPGISSNRSGATNLRSATVTFTGEGSARFECKLDSGSWVGCTSPKSLTNLADGSHTLRSRQIDQAGNVSTESSASWAVQTLVMSSPAALSVGATATVGAGTTVTASGFAYSGQVSVSGSLAAQWQRCQSNTAVSCVDVAGRTASSYVTSSADAGYRLRYVTSYTSTDGLTVDGTTGLSGVVVPVVTAVPSIVIPDSLSAPAYGRTLTLTGPSWTGRPDAAAVAYRWQRCSSSNSTSCATASGDLATQAAYKVTTYEVTRRIRVLVGVTVGSGANQSTVWAASALSAVTTNTAKNTALPVLRYTGGLTAPKRSSAVSVTAGTWAHTWLGKYSYQWQACTSASAGSCTDISGSTKASFTPSSYLVGQRLRAVVTYTGHDGTQVSVITAISSAIAS